ncbi:MAG: hypothetical protein HY211_02105 [Candidatus Omnitrophica bacterium]|nr:hypothetical protein [Candidatus Omnitrophota bacterium]
MEDRFRGLTVALTVVAVAALSVSFLSAAKAKNNQRELVTLRAETQRLKQVGQSLEAGLRETQEKFAQEQAATQGLKEALAQEQLKNKALAEQLQRQQQQVSKAASNAQGPQVKSNLKAR